METVNQENNAANNQEQSAERTFSQSELNAIVEDRLKRDREKYSDYNDLKDKAAKFDKIEEESKSELQKATERAEALQAELDGLKSAEAIRVMRNEVSTATGVPANLLTGSTKEECEAQAQAINAYAKPAGYPAVKDGGEVHAGVAKKTTAQQFAEWSENLF